ncbi:MAG: hypothetical protein IT319_09000 [Anaerolineae bacterium]|nr:hypothetical protein [Anaerolineae bacterium]
MNETFNQITQLSDERFNLYRLAGKQHLSASQLERITQITNQLEVLWDQHRREVASAHRSAPVNDWRSAA